LNGDIFIIKIGQKSGNPSADFLHIRGSGRRCIISSSEECIFQSVRQSFHTKLESLIISAFLLIKQNMLFHRTDVLINAGKAHICWIWEKYIKNCPTISLRGFLQKIHLCVYVSCTIGIFKFVFHNSQIVHEIHKKTCVYKILFVYKFLHKTSYG